MSAAYSPVLVQPNAVSTQGTDNATVFVFQNRPYSVETDNATGHIGVFTSLNNGATWLELDAAGAPVANLVRTRFDGDHTVYVAYAFGVYPYSIKFRDFDLLAGTWGADYGVAGAPVTGYITDVWKRPNGTMLVIHCLNAPLGAPMDFNADSYNIATGIWSPGFIASAGMVTVPGYNAALVFLQYVQTTSIMDSTGAVHFFWDTAGGPGPFLWTNRCFYQQIFQDDTLGVFLNFPNQDTVPQQLQSFSGRCFGTPCVVGDRVVLPVNINNSPLFPQSYPGIYIGTPLAAPVWSINPAASIDPDYLIDNTLWALEAPRLWFNGSSIFAIMTELGSGGLIYRRLRLAQTKLLATPDLGWSAQTIFDTDLGLPPGFDFVGGPFGYQQMYIPSIYSFAGVPIVTSDALSPVDMVTEERYWFGFIAGVPFGGGGPGSGIGGGWGLGTTGAIILRGVRRVRAPQCDEMTDASALPPVKRAV